MRDGLVIQSWNNFRSNIFGFLPAALFCAVCTSIDVRLFPLIPLGLGFIAWRSVASLKLSNDCGIRWWIIRISSYWLNLLAWLLIAGFLCFSFSLLLQNIGGMDASASRSSSILFLSTCLVILSLGFLRTWPSLIATFLVEGTYFYQNPLYRFWFWRRGPVWLGPSSFRVWRWTKNPVIAKQYSPKIVIGFAGVLLLIITGLAVLDSFPLLRLIYISCIYLFLLSPVFLYLSAAAWMAALYAGEPLLVIQPERIDVIEPDLLTIQQTLVEERFFENRFPNQEFGYLTFILPSTMIEREREELMSKIAAVGYSTRLNPHGIIQLWGSVSDYREDRHPEILVDRQKAVIAVQVRNAEGKAREALAYVFSEWRTRFPIMGPDL